MSSISSQQNITTTVLTHFPYENRLSVFVNDQIIPLTHVQGVDTVLFPTLLLSDQHIHRHTFSYNNMVFLLKHFHNKCNDSFYQDDYIISLALGLGGIKVTSIWGNDNVAKHITGVSKSNMQMHMNSKVFIRETNTKKCIALHADDVDKLLRAHTHIKHYDL